ncbi:MAG: DUF4157 domain-containing protein [Kofleriaceae bacterium]|jgi:hypothetical protein|nr:DUF4157 domain-containing protein [Kofleriaceae bacterium]MBP9169633.1 DUF4157 domain-containing protein [Kofleriaceae bacterium]MBP9859475.1 DUF4157 domain-containing protein [Kofleriaceae bacterium]
MERDPSTATTATTTAEGSAGTGTIAPGRRSRLAARYPALAQAMGDRADASIHDAATAAVDHKGSGGTVDGAVAARVGGHLGVDLTGVRVHDDPLSRQATQAMGARAFAYGGDVFLGPGERGDDLGLMAHELTHVAQQGAAGQRAVARAVTVGASDSPAEHEADQVAAEVTSGGPPRSLLVDVGPPQPGQMIKDVFLATLRAQVTEAADAELGPIYSAIGCPYIEQYFGRYATRSAADGEALLRRFAPSVRTATSAAAIIPIVVERVRAGVRHWRDTGDPPPELASLDGGAPTAAAPEANALRGPDGGASLASLERELGPGHAVDGATASRLRDALGSAVPDARIHTGPVAARLADAADAVAFTVGTNIVMGAAAPAAGSLEGDALVAHELAHVAQQADAAADPVARRRPIGPEDATAEDHADRAVATTAARAPASDPWRTGLQLQRCSRNRAPQGPTLQTYADATNAANDPGRLTDDQVRALAEFQPLRNAYGAPTYTEAHALLALRLALRDLQQGQAVDMTAQGATYMQRALAQSGAAGGAEGLVGGLNWAQYNSGLVAQDPMLLADDFSQWLLAAQAQPDPHNGRMNCWELVMFGAFQAGVVSEQRLRQIYQLAVQRVRDGTHFSVGLTFEDQCRGSNPVTYRLGDPNSPRPLRGDIVVFENAPNHACIATGNTVVDQLTGDTHAEVISLWTPNNRHVERTTIEALAQVSDGRPILFWSARWS